MADLISTRSQLATDDAGPLGAISVGTPHFSLAQFEQLRALLRGRSIHPEVDFFVSTGRHVLAQVTERGWLAELEQAGIRTVTDTCLYHAPIFRFRAGSVMTNSAKWAHYGPELVGVKVAFGNLAECVESAVAGKITYAHNAWREA
jgi:predicted aconitase